MKAPLLVAAILAVLGGYSGTAQAQSTSLDFTDYFYDFDLYLADPDSTDWYIVWTLEDGSLLEEGPFQTYESAQDRLIWYYLGGYERGVSAEIQELTKPPTWVYFGTYSTYAEAEDMADYFWHLGLRTDIRAVFDPSRLMQRSPLYPSSSGLRVSTERAVVNTRFP